MVRPPGPDFITTTSNAIDGYDVVQTYGVVRGIVVRSRSIFGTLGSVLQTMRGGNISLLEELCERTRADAYQRAMQGGSEGFCYGTAVRVAPQLRRTVNPQ